MMAVQTKGGTYMLVQRKQNHTHLYGSAEPKFYWLAENTFLRRATTRRWDIEMETCTHVA